ncbi:MAG TPA: N-acetylmuramoyl-L-alanine amidase [Bacillota bacterium]|nr:N-acetylmuramoyl-L-alanine amidase [Bacillota bacterium]
MLKIAIDAGHGLNVAGKEVPSYMGYGKLKEWTLNNRVTLEIIKQLSSYEGIEILRTDDPTGKKNISLKKRVKAANDWGADIFISNHHNAGIKGGFGGGLVVFRYRNSSKFTQGMQRALYDSIINQTGLKGNRATPLSEANFYVIRYTTMPAVLIEHGFMDSPSDMKEIMTPDFASKSARGVVLWLEANYKLKTKAEDSPVDQGANLYRVRKSWSDVRSQIGAYAVLENAKAVADINIGYKVFDEKGKLVYTGIAIEQPKPKKTKVKISVDGYWGSETTKALQITLGTFPDGVISNQRKNSITSTITSGITFGTGGSMVIRALQRLVGADVDGNLGSETVRKLQIYLGTIVDGKLSRPSMVVRELQKRLNKGKL